MNTTNPQPEPIVVTGSVAWLIERDELRKQVARLTAERDAIATRIVEAIEAIEAERDVGMAHWREARKAGRMMAAHDIDLAALGMSRAVEIAKKVAGIESGVTS